MRFVVLIRWAGTGYSVDVPDLPRCIATGTTVERARRMIAEAIEMHLDLMQKSGEPIPAPSLTYEFEFGDRAAEELCTWVEVDDSKSAINA